MARAAAAWLALTSLSLAVGLACTGDESAGRRPAARLAVAANFAAVLPQLMAAFVTSGGIEPVASLGSSGWLARQIDEGAPFDAFVSADVEWVQRVIAGTACDPAQQGVFALGRLALFSTSQPPPERLADLARRKTLRLAIANPETAPYGRAALEVLARASVREGDDRRWLIADNVRQAAQMAESGNADYALVALPLARQAKGARYLEIAANDHTPIQHSAVACSRGPNSKAGRDFVAFLRSETARRILVAAGYGAPEGESRSP